MGDKGKKDKNKHDKQVNAKRSKQEKTRKTTPVEKRGGREKSLTNPLPARKL